MRAVDQPGDAQRRDGRQARRDRGAGRREHAADPRRLSFRHPGPGRRRSSRPTRPTQVNDAFKEVTAAQQQDAKSYVNQANAYALQLTAEGAGRGDGVRQGLCAVQARARSDPPPHVLRDDGAGAFEGRQDDRRGAGRDALSAAAAGAEVAAAARSGSNDRLRPQPADLVGDRRLRRCCCFCSAASRSCRKPSRRWSCASASRCAILNRFKPGQPIGAAGAGLICRHPVRRRDRLDRQARPGRRHAARSRCCRPTSAGSRSTPSRATASSIRC